MKRGQASIEFLVTYGWAILGVLIVISTLAYFGFFKTAKYSPDTCSFGEQFKCIDYTLDSANGAVIFKIVNGFTVPMKISVDGWDSAGTPKNCILNGGEPQIINSGAAFEGACQLGVNNIAPNEKVKIKVQISFNKEPNGEPHTQSGHIYVTAQ